MFKVGQVDGRAGGRVGRGREELAREACRGPGRFLAVQVTKAAA